MAFKNIDQRLIDECTKDIINIEIIKSLISTGADVNAFDSDYAQELYDSILDYYIDAQNPNLSNLYKITNLFLEGGLVLSQNQNDSDYFLPSRFRFLPPDKTCVDTFKLLLEKGSFSFYDLDQFIDDATLDLHLGEYYFYEDTHYSKNDSINYYLELIYWACAYNAKVYPEKCKKDVLQFDLFDRKKNKVELIEKNHSTAVFIECLKTKHRIEISGWSMKY